MRLPPTGSRTLKAFNPAELRDEHGRWTAFGAVVHALGGKPTNFNLGIDHGNGDVIDLPDGNKVKIWTIEGPGHVTLKDVTVMDRGKGVGMKVIHALVKHADEHGVPLILDDVQNRKFGDRIVRDVPGFFYSGPELYRYPGGVKKAFDPDQPRGSDGRWISLVGYIKRYLESSKEIRGNPPAGFAHNSFDSYVLEHGRAYKPPVAGGLSPEYEKLRGNMKECFRNATNGALGTKQLTYVEGYALAGNFPIPLSHGWLVTKDGRVEDPTWRDGVAYFGVPFTTEQLRESLLRTQVWGMFHHLNAQHFLGE